MRLLALSPCRQALRLFACSIICMPLAAPTLAQDAPEPQPAAEPVAAAVQLDAVRMLSAGWDQSPRDPVWSIRAGVGRRIVALPLIVGPVDQETELSRPDIKPSSSRFIGYFVPNEASGLDWRPSELDLQRLVDADAAELEAMLFPEPTTEQNALPGEAGFEDPAGFGQPADADEDAQAQVDGDALVIAPDSAPRLARELIFYPDGTVGWEMLRTVYGGELSRATHDQPYPYLLDADMLRAEEPERGERITRNEGEDSRAFAERRRAAQLQEREAQEAFRELRTMLRDLPTEFREPAPPVVYALFDVADDDELEVEGPAPLPWRLADEDRQLVVELMQGRFNSEHEQRMVSLARLGRLAEAHPLGARVIASAVLQSQLTGSVETDGPGYALVAQLLESDDLIARRTALFATARTSPHTVASAQLLDVAGRAATDEERRMLQFAAMRALFEVEANNPQSTALLVAAINQSIADPQGPAVARVIDYLLVTLSQASNRGFVSEESSAIVDGFVDGVAIDQVPDDQFDAVATAVIRHAPHSPVAAGWLDVKLLRGSSPARVTRTLELLAQIEPAAIAQVEGMPERVATIPISSPEHGLVAAFDSEVPGQQELAWQVVDRFHIVQPPRVQGEEAGTTSERENQAVALFNVIMSKAAGQETASDAIVSFMVNQPEAQIQQAAQTRMVSLIGGPDTSDALAGYLVEMVLESPGSYTNAIRAQDTEGQARTLSAMYEASGKQAPLAVRLIRNPSVGMLGWFMTELQSGELPSGADWGMQAGGERQLLQLAQSEDDLLASGAAAALVNLSGGNTEEEQRFARVIQVMDPRNAERVNGAWSDFKAALYTRVFGAARGDYQLVLTILPQDEAEGFVDPFDVPEPAPEVEGDAGESVGTRVELGIVAFEAVGGELSLSVEGVELSITPDRLGIRINEVSSLRVFTDPALEPLRLADAAMPIDLLPQEDGSWSGTQVLGGGQAIRVTLEPQ